MNIKQRMMLSQRNAGMIPFVAKQYQGMLTAEFLDDWLDLLKQNLIDPEYIFLNQRAMDELSHNLTKYMMFDKDNQPSNVAQYRGKYVVVFPTLPDKVVLAGDLVLDAQ